MCVPASSWWLNPNPHSNQAINLGKLVVIHKPEINVILGWFPWFPGKKKNMIPVRENSEVVKIYPD